MLDKPFRLTALLVLGLLVAGCKSADERAEEYFQSGMALVESGDLDRAAVEFRNVFELNGQHRDARFELAKVLLAQGRDRGAYSQLLRLAEQYPEDAEARIVLSELAFANRSWEELERHGEAAAQLAPNDPRVEIINLGRDYHASLVDEDGPRRDSLRDRAVELLASSEESEILRSLVIDAYARDADFSNAIKHIDILIEQDPDNKDLYLQRLGLLGQIQDRDAIEAALLDMTARFDDSSFKSTLLRFYLSNGEVDRAEAFLADQVDPSSENIDPALDYVRFLAEVRGNDAALSEIAKLLETTPRPAPFRAVRANINFFEGRVAEGIAELEEVLADAEPSDETRNVKAVLAQMMLANSNPVAARQLVEEILAEDQSHPHALRLSAARRIDEDDITGAIADLRGALDKDPEDVQALTLMATAYQRNGNTDLTREFLSLAAEASGNAPEESLRFAQFLIAEGRYLPAEDALIPALRLSPGNVAILRDLGQIYLALEDNARLEQVIRSLRSLENENATNIANGLEAERLNRQGGEEEAIAFLEGLASQDDSDTSAKLLLLQARVSTGDMTGALELAETLAKANPDNQTIRFALSAVRTVSGDLEGAERDLRDLIDTSPNRPQFWLELSRVVIRQGRTDEGIAVIDEGLSANPDAADLLWAKASILERDGDYEGAISIYEELYERQSSSVIVANNLASLLASHRDDTESLERAYAISRRLAGAEIPQLQDTYGWITFRNGEVEEALPYLEAAARGLPTDAQVQFHLGMAYSALDRREEAIEQLRRVLLLAGDLDTRPQIAAAREELARLEALPDE